MSFYEQSQDMYGIYRCDRCGQEVKDCECNKPIPAQTLWRESSYQVQPTLRQMYAMAAMQGIVSTNTEASNEYVSAAAFALADAMLQHEANEPKA